MLGPVYREIRILARDHQRLADTYHQLAEAMRDEDLGDTVRTSIGDAPVDQTKTQNGRDPRPIEAFREALRDALQDADDERDCRRDNLRAR